MNGTALPAGTRLRDGALLIEDVLRREEKAFVYRAYDLPARRQLTLIEYFPPHAKRFERAVLAPHGWSAQGIAIARQKFLESQSSSLFSFEENDTLYIATEYSALEDSHPTGASASPPSAHATVALTPLATNDASPKTTSPSPPEEPVVSPAHSATAPTPSITKRQVHFSWRDVVPDAWRGAAQGAAIGGGGGVLLGALASLFGQNDVISGVLRGLYGVPIGAVAGALLGALRALPSSAPQLATASARSRDEQVQSTLAGAGKGALLGLFLLPVMIGVAASNGAFLSLGLIAQALFLCLLIGAFSGAVVGFIRVHPRDRSRR